MLTSEQLIQLPIKHPEFQNDFSKRYRDTYIWINSPKNKEPNLVKVRGFITDYCFEGQTLNRINKSYDLRDQTLAYDIFLPDSGYYAVGDYTFYLFKAPQRQWKRSFCETIYQIKYTYSMYETRDLGWADLIKGILYTNYNITLNNISKLKQGQSVVLSRQFICFYNPSSNLYKLHYRTIPIGTINFDSKSITDVDPLLHQEVLDLLKRTKTTDWIVEL